MVITFSTVIEKPLSIEKVYLHCINIHAGFVYIFSMNENNDPFVFTAGVRQFTN